VPRPCDKFLLRRDVLCVKLFIYKMAFVYTNPYRSSYLAAQEELSKRLAEAEALQFRIKALQDTISALRPLAESDSQAPPSASLPEACYEALANAKRPLTALEVRHRLGLMGITIQGSNPMAILHTTLHRMAKVKRSKGTDGKTYFEAIPAFESLDYLIGGQE
jgi:hypothetical protein